MIFNTLSFFVDFPAVTLKTVLTRNWAGFEGIQAATCLLALSIPKEHIGPWYSY